MPDPTGVRIVVPGDLAEIGAQILGIANNIGEELSQLRNLLAPMHEYWLGGAHDNWQPLQAQWDAAANDLMAAPGTLGAIAHAVTLNSQNYHDTESANTSTWAHH